MEKLVESEEGRINDIVAFMDEIKENFSKVINSMLRDFESEQKDKLYKKPFKLPPVTILKFNEKIKEWTAFKNLIMNVKFMKIKIIR